MQGTPLDWVRQAAGQLPQPINQVVNTATDIAEGIIFADGSLPAGTNPADIYAWFHNGPGTAGYQQATDTLGTLAGAFPDYTAQIKAAQQDVANGWKSPAAQESVRSFDPLVQASTKLEQHAANAQASVAAQISSFDDTRNRVVPVPAQPPSGPGMNQFTQPFAPDNLTADAAVAAYQVATHNNQDAYGSYQGQTGPQGTSLPRGKGSGTDTTSTKDRPVPGPNPVPQPTPTPTPAPTPSPTPSPTPAPPRGDDPTKRGNPGNQSGTPPAQPRPPGHSGLQSQHPGGTNGTQPPGGSLPGPVRPGTPSTVQPTHPSSNLSTLSSMPALSTPFSSSSSGLGGTGGGSGSSASGFGGGVGGFAGTGSVGRNERAAGGFTGAGPYSQERTAGRTGYGTSGGATGRQGGGQSMGGGGHGNGDDDKEHRTKYVLKVEHESELVGDLPAHAPSVIEGFDDDDA